MPTLAAAAADPAADARLLEEIARFCGRFTPMVAVEPPDGLVLDVTGCAHLFSGEASLRARVVAALARRGVEARAALADGPDAARAFARFASVDIVPPGEAPDLARRLPIAALECLRRRLSRWPAPASGGERSRRPAARHAQRPFRRGRPLKLDRLLGREERRITPLRPAARLRRERRFPAPLLEADALMEALARLVADIARLLESRAGAVAGFEAFFFRTDGAVRTLRVETARPCRDPGIVLRLFRERMEALADPIDPGFGFDALRLEVPSTDAFTPEAPDFDRRAAGDSDLDALVDRLTARFGRDRVQRFQPVDIRMIPAVKHGAWRRSMRQAQGTGDSRTPASRRSARCSCSTRPSRSRCWPRCPTGRRCASAGGACCTRSRAREGRSASPPNGGAPPASMRERDYYRIEDTSGRRFWVFREGLYGGAEPPRWFLHGLFA